jgi:Zn finger protein HypA/HybF involved in hydrogenase expression
MKKLNITKESSVNLENDPAYTCPNCGSHKCELEDADDLNFFELNHYDGAKVEV